MIKKRPDPMALACGLLFLIFGIFAFLYPYSGDDWTWGSRVGMERLSIFFANYNGRYLGNLLELAVTRSKLLDILAMAVAHTFCCWACWKYSPDRKPATALLAVVLFFLMPTSIYSQSVVWTAGFSNYVPSAMLSLGYMLVIRNITDAEAPVYSRGTVPVVFAVGFCGALFMESITLFNICLAVAVIGYTALKFRRWYTAHVSFLAGAVLGAAAMFSNGAYRTIADGTDYYRTVADTAYEIIIYIVKHAKQILDYLIYENFLFCVILSLLAAVLLLEHRKTASPRRNDYARVQSDRGDEVIYICQLPYEERLHDGSPVKDRLKERYLMFHGLDETATLEFVSRQELDTMIRAED